MPDNTPTKQFLMIPTALTNNILSLSAGISEVFPIYVNKHLSITVLVLMWGVGS